MGVALKTEKVLTEDRPLKGDRSFRSRSAGPIGPFLPIRSFRSLSSIGERGKARPPTIQPSRAISKLKMARSGSCEGLENLIIMLWASGRIGRSSNWYPNNRSQPGSRQQHSVFVYGP